MKCAHCLKDSNKKERITGFCPGCSKAFVFEPTAGDRFTDFGFLSAINRVSGHGTVKFLPANLFYEFKRVKKGVAAVVLVASGAAVLTICVAATGNGILAGVLGAVGVAGSLLVNATRRPFGDLEPLAFANAHARWIEKNGTDPQQIVPRALPAEAKAHLQAELEAYSFDRAVITDSADTAELLLANDFHFENNCAVLSIDGAPAHAFELVREMLRKNPRLEVFALHDCTPDGCNLAFRLKHDPAWFKDFGTVHDVALRPAPARSKSLKALCRPAREKGTQHASISKSEAAWLDNWSLELAAIRPEQLIKRLYRSMQDPKAPGTDGDAGSGVVVWSTDATASDGGADSFG